MTIAAFPIPCPVSTGWPGNTIMNVVTFVVNVFDDPHKPGATVQQLETFSQPPSNPSDVITGGLDSGLNANQYGTLAPPGPIPLYYDVSTSPRDGVTLVRVVIGGPLAGHFQFDSTNCVSFSDAQSAARQNIWCARVRQDRPNVAIFYAVTKMRNTPSQPVDELTINLIDNRTEQLISTDVDPQIKNNG